MILFIIGILCVIVGCVMGSAGADMETRWVSRIGMVLYSAGLGILLIQFFLSMLRV